MNRGHALGIVGIICLIVFCIVTILFTIEENMVAVFKISAIYFGVISIIGILVRKYREWLEKPLF